MATCPACRVVDRSGAEHSAAIQDGHDVISVVVRETAGGTEAGLLQRAYGCDVRGIRIGDHETSPRPADADHVADVRPDHLGTQAGSDKVGVADRVVDAYRVGVVSGGGGRGGVVLRVAADRIALDESDRKLANRDDVD